MCCYICGAWLIESFVEEDTGVVKDQTFLANLKVNFQALLEHPVRLLTLVCLNFDLFNELLVEDEGLLEDLIESAISKV